MIKNKKTLFENIFSDVMLQKLYKKNSFFSKKQKEYLFLTIISLVILALSRPQIYIKDITIKSSYINLVTAFDFSNSMFASDLYPNRFQFAQKKFIDNLKYFKKTKIAVIGFSNDAFLVSPMSDDFYSLKYLIKNISLNYISQKGTNILSALKAANKLYENDEKKAILIFSDGGDNKDFSKEIAYAKAHNISVFVYNCATREGGAIKIDNNFLKDKSGNLVIVKANENIKNLALKTGGAYMPYSLKQDDLKLLTDAIYKKFEAKSKDEKISDYKELFYYPLILAIILFFLYFFQGVRDAKNSTD
jgi:Ca-activated chloride channel family protein